MAVSRRWPKRFWAGMVLLVGFPFLAFYWMQVLRLLPGGANVPLLSFIFLFPYLLVSRLFTSSWVYLALTVGSLAAAGVVWWRYRASGWMRWVVVVVAVAVLAFPFACHYRPALEAAPGYVMLHATAPGFPGGVAKSARNFAELPACTYTLLGWDETGALYYEERCGDGGRVMRYNPQHPEAGSVPVVGDTPALSLLPVPRDEALAMVRARVWPKEDEAAARRLSLEAAARSPDGRWTAMLVHHVYGTQDVLVLSAQ